MRWFLFATFSIVSVLVVRPARASGTVTNCTEAELDAALAGGGNVLIACNGLIPFTSTKVIATNTTVDATDYSCTLSGSNRVRLFVVNTGAVLTLRNLTLAFGAVTNAGAGFADGGAAVLNRGTLQLDRCLIVSNRVIGMGGTVASGAQGGAIHNKAGVVTANECTFLTNSCVGGFAPNGTPTHTTGYTGGNARGGAILSEMGSCWITNSCFARNGATGANGGRGVNDPDFGGSGGDGGSALGGALFINASTVALVNSTLASNLCRGGNGGLPGVGLETGDSGFGGDGEGGGIANVSGTIVCVNATLAANRAIAGSGFFSGVPGGDNLDNFGGTVAFTNTIIAYGVRTNATGATVIDGGNNISSDGSCRFTIGSVNGTNPQLLFLGDNGGPTPTMLPRPESVAINAANAGPALARDQRGFARHLLPDIGAVEFQPPRILNPSAGGGHVRFEVMAENGVAHRVEFAPSVPYTNWFSLAATFTSTNRIFPVDDDLAGTTSNRFYRIAIP